MTQGEPEAAVEAMKLFHRQQLRIRTVAVSFAAAVTSARHDFDVTAAERDAMIEVWRAWSLGQLDRYGSELDQLEVDHAGYDSTLATLRVQLAESIATVRAA